MSRDYDIEKEWEHNGLKCVVIFNNNSGSRCGYVGIPPAHPLFGSDYNKPAPILTEVWKKVQHQTIGKRGIFSILAASLEGGGTRPDVIFDVHGGLTFSGGDKDYPIKTTEPIWWFGYDCAHAGDVTNYIHMPGDVHRSLEYCIGECESLADQLQSLTKGE